jgi:hypothetical protein
MSLRFRRLVCVVGVIPLVFALCPARGDDAEDVKKKLYEAKKTYDTEGAKFRKGITDLLDKRETDARKAGNKKLVDQIKAEQKAFEQTGELPALIPTALRQQITTARGKLDKAYTTAIKDYTKLKEDTAAEAVEKERQKFQLSAALAFGKRIYLAGLKHSDLKIENPTGFSNNGTDPNSKIKLKLDGELVPHSIFLVPPPNGSSEVTYPLTGKLLAFRVAVGVTRIGDDAGDPGTPLTFEVLGDGKSLWKSKPVAKLDVYETCELRLEKIQKLTLRVSCPGPNTLARAMWYEPILAE